MLVSSSSCIQGEGGDFTLSFEEERDLYEGVLDGGHNMLAVGLFILEEYFGEEANKELRGVDNWDSFIGVWRKHQKSISEILDLFEFEMPIEIIYPTTEYSAQFPESIFEISDARNNNFALSSGTKADHKGYYKILKSNIDDEIEKEIEWKDGGGQRIKRDDIVAMSLIPLLALQEANKLKKNAPRINPISIYSSKGKCVETFSLLFDVYSNEKDEITDPLFLSAMELLKDIPRLYDLIYQKFPRAYNDHSSRFGGIECVKVYEDGKSGKSYLKKQPSTKYYKEKCNSKYPDGFIIPIFVSLSELIEIGDEKVKWKMADPKKFIEDNLSKGVQLLINTIKDNNYNPNQVGKSKGAYESVKMMFKYLS